jgi:NAD(P)-dependent dehydrogenase (short-subunit alcohol dehydrogenase family)
MNLEGKNIVVTGGANGVGKAVGLWLAKAGASCAIIDLDADASARAVSEIEAKGGRAVAVVGDITRKESADALFAGAVSAFGRIDGLVNSAGIYPRSPILEISDDAWDANFAVNLRGLYHMSVAAVVHMRGQGGGRIVNVSSVAGLKPHPGNAHYACMKAGVISLTKSFGIEFAKDKVLVNGIAPGWIATDKAKEAGNIFQPWALAEMPLGRAAEPTEIADLILFLLSDHNTYLVGETVTISGGTYIA